MITEIGVQSRMKEKYAPQKVEVVHKSMAQESVPVDVPLVQAAVLRNNL
jgi:hypothetical protein